MSGTVPPPSLFQSFWLAGFEGASHINARGQRLNMLEVVQHDAQAASDYALLHTVGIRAARDGVRWPLIDVGDGRYDFSSLAPMAAAARAQGIQVLWTLCHYGWPDDVEVFGAAFVDRFARYSGAVARYFRDQSDEVPYYTPINEISFLSWAAGEVAWFHPFGQRRGMEMKRQLVRAVIAACDAIWAVDPRARIAHVDPLIHVVTPRDRPDLAEAAAAKRASQWQALDMLAGRLEPELGGAPRYLDILGINFYHANEEEFDAVRLRWEDEPRDERWVPFHRLAGELYQRYERPVFVGETSHFGAGRVRWLREMTDEVIAARTNGVPIEGVCLYPILDRPDWEDLNHWHNSGLWDLVRAPDGALRRVLNAEYAAELRRSQERLAAIGCGEPPA